jgi:hypothetical protein
MSLIGRGEGIGEGAYSGLPDGYQYSKDPVTGSLQLWKGLELIGTQNSDGSWFKTAVSTGVGSIHLGGEHGKPTHSLKSAGQNATFTNEAFDNNPDNAMVWFPPWQGVRANLASVVTPTFLEFGALQTALQINGSLLTNTVPYSFTSTIASNICVSQVTVFVGEAYTGKLTNTIKSSATGRELHRADVDVTVSAGNSLNIKYPVPYFARQGDVLIFSLTKENGDPLLVRAGAANVAQPWRGLRARSFTDIALQGNMAPNSVKVNNDTTTKAPIDLAITANQLVGRGSTGNVRAVEFSEIRPETVTKQASFVALDGGTYIVEQQTKAETGDAVETLYQFRGDIVTGASVSTGTARSIFKNNPDKTSTSPDGWGSPWSSHDENSAAACRVTLDFGETVQLIAMEWQGQGNTGYNAPNGPLPISGPRTMTLRLSSSPFTPAVNSGTGNLMNASITTQNLNWGANQSSPNGLAERYDIKAANGGAPVAARYFALDLLTSWDTRNMLLKHILFTYAKPVGDLDINVTITPTVNSFTILDGTANVAPFSAINVILGVDTVRFSKPFVGKSYNFIRNGSKFICAGSDGSRTEVNI